MRAFNFCAGPAALPETVLKQAQAELLDYKGGGASVMELSHRSSAFVEVAEEAEKDLRELLGISDQYAVLFLQGGASMQFSMVPLNLAKEGAKVDYICTGAWSQKAIKEARKFADVNVAASTEQSGFSGVPARSEWQLNEDSAYLHITPNETIHGVEFLDPIDVDPRTVLVADLSSTLLSRPLDVDRYGLIYAGAQKNIGPAGLTLVIVRKDLLGRSERTLPAMLDYAVHAKADSMYNTPPTYSWYLAGLVFKWIKKQGGLKAMAELNARKADKLYRAIDESALYRNPVEASARSWMNVPFILENTDLEASFLTQAEERGLLNLKGHRSVGGMRASLYNAVPEEAVDALIEFMREFEQHNS